MARDSQKPDITASSLGNTVSSEDLLKDAWESMGRARSGERLTGEESQSGAMTTSASASRPRTETAEEIAQMLRQETERRQTPERSTPTQRQVEPRPRRTTPVQVPPPPVRPRPQAPIPTTDDGQPRRTRRSLGWVAFAVFWIVASLVGAFLEDSSTDPPDIEIVTPRPELTSTTLATAPEAVFVSIRDVEVGQCIAALPAGELVNDVPIVPCDDAHEFEVFANTVLTGEGFPDDVFDAANDVCLPFFEGYVGESYASSDYFIEVIAPTEGGWKANDRAVNCLLYLWDQEALEVVSSTGTARDSGGATS